LAEYFFGLSFALLDAAFNLPSVDPPCFTRVLAA